MTPRFRTPSCTVAAGRLRPLALVSGFLLSVILAFAAPAKFDIPAQPAPAALQLFMKQSGASVMYSADQLGKVRTAEVKGELEPLTALQQLLAGTDFNVRQEGPTSFVIEPATTKPGSVEGSVQSESGRPVAGARVSLVGSNQTVLTDKRGRFTFEEVPAGSQALAITAEGMQNTKVTDVNVKAGHRLTLSDISIPVVLAGAVKLEDYIVSARKIDGVVELDPYEVKTTKEKPFSGSSIDVQRTKNDALPYTTYSSDDIERSGATTLTEFFRERLSQSTSPFIPEEQMDAGRSLENPSNFTSNQLNLANGGGQMGALGAGEVVFLVNGRRLPNRTYGGSPGADPKFTAGDINGIPVASIERIEVLSSAGSAIYGAGATAGVFNIITKQNYKGGSVSLSYETPTDTNAPKRSLEFTYALPLPAGYSFRLSYHHNDTKPLRLSDRADVTIERLRRYILAREPNRLGTLAAVPLGATTNFQVLTPSFEVAYYSSVPDGYAGGSGVTPFLARQGVYNLALAQGTAATDPIGTGFGANSWIGPRTQNDAFTATLEKSFGENWRVIAEYSRQSGRLIGQASPYTSFGYSFIVPDTAPINPFGEYVLVNFYDHRLEKPDFIHNLKTGSEQGILSVRGTHGDWRSLFDVSMLKTYDDASEIGFEPLTGSDWSTAYMAGAYNPFVDMRTVAPAAQSFYDEYRKATLNHGSDSRTIQAAAKMSGPILNFNGGTVHLTSGLEWIRTERGNYYYDRYRRHSLTGVVMSGSQKIRYAQPAQEDAVSLYSETTIPLVGGPNSVPLVEGADLFLSGRVERQILERGEGSIDGSTSSLTPDGATLVTIMEMHRTFETTPYVYAGGVRIQFLGGLMFRFSQSIGFKPPTFAQTIEAPVSTEARSVIDRRTGQSVVLQPEQYREGGNPDLEPEETQSTSFGLVWSPAWHPGLRLSADYVENLRDTAISGLSLQDVLDLEASDSRIAARVSRNSAGVITSIDARSINFREVVSKVATFTAEERLENAFGGRLIVSAAATKTISFRIQTSNDAPAVEQVRNPTAMFSYGFRTRWNGNMQARWERGRWTFGWAGKYFDDIVVRPSDRTLQGGDRIGSIIEHDLLCSYRLDAGGRSGKIDRWISDATISLGVKNVFNREPRFSAASGLSGLGYVGQDSLYGRSIWVQVKRDF